jgi:hypothetical protein
VSAERELASRGTQADVPEAISLIQEAGLVKTVSCKEDSNPRGGFCGLQHSLFSIEFEEENRKTQ